MAIPFYASQIKKWHRNFRRSFYRVFIRDLLAIIRNGRFSWWISFGLSLQTGKRTGLLYTRLALPVVFASLCWFLDVRSASPAVRSGRTRPCRPMLPQDNHWL